MNLSLVKRRGRAPGCFASGFRNSAIRKSSSKWGERELRNLRSDVNYEGPGAAKSLRGGGGLK